MVRVTLSRLLPVLVALYLVVACAVIGHYGVRQARFSTRFHSDFFIFYSAAFLATSPVASELYNYDKDYWATTSYITAPPAAGNFFNPPFVAYLYWPFTRTSEIRAQVINLGLSVAAAGFVAGLVLFWAPHGRRLPYLVVSVLTMVSFWPLYMTLAFGHPSLYFAALTGLAIIELESAAPVSAGGYIGLLALKPSLFIAPLGLLAWRRRFRSALAAAGLSFFLVIVPFMFLGIQAMLDFRNLTSTLTADAFRLEGIVTVGAIGLFNWNGFWVSVFKTAPPYPFVLAMDALTIALMLKTWTTGTLREALLAGIAALLLCLPHLLAYDWVLLLPAAIAVACERPSRALLGVFVIEHVLINTSFYQQIWVESVIHHHDLGGFWAIPGLLLVIAFLAFRPQVEAWLERLSQRLPGHRPVTTLPAPAGLEA